MLRKLMLLVFLTSCALLAAGQSNYAALSGTVVDPHSRAIPTAAIEVNSALTGAIRRAVSNDQGLFELPGLAPGEYQLKVSAPGFAVLTQGVRLEVGQKLTLNI